MMENDYGIKDKKSKYMLHLNHDIDYDNLDKKLVAIGKELEKNLDNWEAWAAKADILYSLGMLEIAIRCCDKSLAINPGNTLTLATKVNALEKLGKHDEAVAVFVRAREQGYLI